ncbi:hypothetical protein FB45DRAFT_715501, partial [Roridomyces roridus]
EGQAMQAPSFSISTGASVSSTGWHGARPPLEARKLLDDLYDDPQALNEALSHLHPVPYEKRQNWKEEKSMRSLDRDGHVIMFRSRRAVFLRDNMKPLELACHLLLEGDLEKESVQNRFKNQVRGPHMALVIGHHRQYVREPMLTEWHRAHSDRVAAFLSQDIIKRIIQWITQMVELVFPGIAKRFREDVEKIKQRYPGVEPLFGLFWNFCLNAQFPGQRRIHCLPHADWKNQIGVCALLVYLISGGEHFDDDRKTWLVVWEIALAIQLPAWVLHLYPSALFYHFNVDVDDVKFVTTAGEVVHPTQANSTPLHEDTDCGRGSMVFFNQATMRCFPETGYDLLSLAPEEQRTFDYEGSIESTFVKY